MLVIIHFSSILPWLYYPLLSLSPHSTLPSHLLALPPFLSLFYFLSLPFLSSHLFVILSILSLLSLQPFHFCSLPSTSDTCPTFNWHFVIFQPLSYFSSSHGGLVSSISNPLTSAFGPPRSQPVSLLACLFVCLCICLFFFLFILYLIVGH